MQPDRDCSCNFACSVRVWLRKTSRRAIESYKSITKMRLPRRLLPDALERTLDWPLDCPLAHDTAGELGTPLVKLVRLALSESESTDRSKAVPHGPLSSESGTTVTPGGACATAVAIACSARETTAW